MFKFFKKKPKEEQENITLAQTVTEPTLGDLISKAENGDSEACSELGRKFYFGIGVEIDFVSAIEWFTLALQYDESNVNAIYYLANALEYGNGVEKNEEYAFLNYKTLHENGIYQGTYELGRCLLYGIGCDINYEAAAGLFYEAGEQNIPEAIYYLGACYSDGLGVEQDYEEAYNLFSVAAKAGVEEAIEVLNLYRENGFDN